MKKGIIWILLFLLFFSSFGGQAFALDEANNSSNLDEYVKYFYNRYSLHFDSHGLRYSSRSYGVGYRAPETAREWMALASYYKYRALKDEKGVESILRNGIFSAYNEMVANKSYKGFAAAEANFLAIRMMEANPDLIDEGIKKDILDYIASNLKEAILGYDWENRQLVAVAHWQYINNYLFEEGIIDSEEKQEIDKILKDLIDWAILECVNQDYWYFENGMKDFSPHYQAVSAFMLLVYGDLTGQDYYVDLSREMYYNLKKISFRNGMVEARLGHRPIGLGAQFYLILGLLGKYFKDDDYRVYLFYGRGYRFFSDERYPNRLEFHSTIENSSPDFHDDYAFSDIAELGLVIPALRDIDLRYKVYFTRPARSSLDKTFKIYNNGRVIFINNRKNVLGSYGNWSHLYTFGR